MASKTPVLKYSQFLLEKQNQNLAKLDMGKGSKTTAEIGSKNGMDDIAEVPKSGKKLTKEVKNNLETLPKGGKMTAKSADSNLAKLNIKGTPAKQKPADSNLAKLPGKKK